MPQRQEQLSPDGELFTAEEWRQKTLEQRQNRLSLDGYLPWVGRHLDDFKTLVELSAQLVATNPRRELSWSLELFGDLVKLTARIVADFPRAPELTAVRASADLPLLMHQVQGVGIEVKSLFRVLSKVAPLIEDVLALAADGFSLSDVSQIAASLLAVLAKD